MHFLKLRCVELSCSTYKLLFVLVSLHSKVNTSWQWLNVYINSKQLAIIFTNFLFYTTYFFFKQLLQQMRNVICRFKIVLENIVILLNTKYSLN